MNIFFVSTVSSGVNALALVFLTDIAKPLYRFKTGKRLSERASTILSKILGIASFLAHLIS